MKNSIENTLKIIVAITGIICAIAACIAINDYLSGNDISASSSNSQTNPPAVPTAPLISTPTAAPAPTQQSTDTTPTPDSNDSGNSVSFSTPTPPPTPTPITAIDLPFGVTATNTITPATTSHMYKVELPQAGKLTVNITRSGNIGLLSGYRNLFDSTGNKLPNSGFFRLSYPVYSTRSWDLEAGIYYVEIAKDTSVHGGYDLTANFVPF